MIDSTFDITSKFLHSFMFEWSTTKYSQVEQKGQLVVQATTPERRVAIDFASIMESRKCKVENVGTCLAAPLDAIYTHHNVGNRRNVMCGILGQCPHKYSIRQLLRIVLWSEIKSSATTSIDAKYTCINVENYWNCTCDASSVQDASCRSAAFTPYKQIIPLIHTYLHSAALNNVLNIVLKIPGRSVMGQYVASPYAECFHVICGMCRTHVSRRFGAAGTSTLANISSKVEWCRLAGYHAMNPCVTRENYQSYEKSCGVHFWNLHSGMYTFVVHRPLCTSSARSLQETP